MRQLSFISRSRFLLCGGSLHSSSGFRGLRTAEHVVRTFRYAPKGGQSSKYLCHETLRQLFCFTDEYIYLFTFSASSFPFAFTCALKWLSVIVVEVILILQN